MKVRKLVALVLSASMLMGVVAGCSKVKKVDQKSMDKAADKLEAKTYDDYEDLMDVSEKDLKKGVYLSLDRDGIEDILDDLDDEVEEFDEVLEIINDSLDSDLDYDFDDLQEASLYARVDKNSTCAVLYIDCGNDEIAADIFNTILDLQEDANDELEDILDDLDMDYFEDFELDLNNLGKDEFYFNHKDTGYLKFCVTIEDIEDYVDNDLPEILDEIDLDVDEDDIEDELDEMMDEIPFDLAAGGIYFNGSVIVVTFIFSDDDDFIDDYDSFMKTIGLSSPTDVYLSDYTKKLITFTVFSNVARYITRARSVAESKALTQDYYPVGETIPDLYEYDADYDY